MRLAHVQDLRSLWKPDEHLRQDLPPSSFDDDLGHIPDNVALGSVMITLSCASFSLFRSTTVLSGARQALNGRNDKFKWWLSPTGQEHQVMITSHDISFNSLPPMLIYTIPFFRI